MIEARHASRKLYLAKGDSLDIHIDPSLPQYQIEGVRFLYRTFIKKKPGVVLNDPPGYGKRVQTVIFLNAIRLLLDKPVLILCKKGMEKVWLSLFSRWSGLGLEISVELCNPPVLKHFIYINPMSKMKTFCRREWSVVVVDDRTVHNDLHDATLNTHFKIWLTGEEMKTNLPSFSMIYQWLYPKDSFDVEDFQVIKRKPSTVYMKSAILDAFMEDIVLRRKVEILPFEWNDEIVRELPILTRKNKDSTGKKIKRTKPDSNPPQRTPDPPKSTNLNPMANIPMESMAKDILEHFITDLQTYRQENLEINDAEVDIVVKKRKLLNATPHQQLDPDEELDVINYDDDNINTEESVNLLNDGGPSQDIRIRYESGSENDPNAMEVVDNQENKCDDTSAPEVIENNKESVDLFSTDENEIETRDINDSTKELLKKVRDREKLKENHDECTGSDSGNITIHSSLIDVRHDNMNKERQPNGEDPPALITVIKEPEIDIIVEKKTVVGDIPTNMKILEELAMRKFKGTLLDRLF